MIFPDINHYFRLALLQVSTYLVNVIVNRKGMTACARGVSGVASFITTDEQLQ